jgi:cellobiose epimerase
MTNTLTSVAFMILLLSAACVAGAVPERADYLRLVSEAEANLRKHVLAPWYPRAVDKQRGGFIQDYDERWNQTGSGRERSVVYQSRLTWTAAQVVKRYPDHAGVYKEYVRHGLGFLRTKQWDAEQGGFFWQVDAVTGKPTDGRGEKHVYGIAFGIYAAAAGHEVTHDAAALDLAKRAFAWLEEHAHDAKNGGYYEALIREGKPILTAAMPRSRDFIGTAYGYKSMNTHIHLLEAFGELYAVWKDPLLRKRLEEVFHVVRDKVYVEPGCLNLFFTPDWRPVPDHDSFGHDIETAYLLAEAAHNLGIPDDPATWKAARNLVDHALEYGWDANTGGFYDTGTAFGPATGKQKVWWTEAEGLNALLLMHERFGKETPRYWQAFVKQWEFIQKRQVDEKNLGWYSEVHEDGTAPTGRSKSNAWTDPYHQGRALMNVAAMLKRLAGS